MSWNWIVWFLKTRGLSVAEKGAYRWKKESVRLIRELSLTEKLVEDELDQIEVLYYEAVGKLDLLRYRLDDVKNKLNEKRVEVGKKIEQINRHVENHDRVEEALTTELKILKEIVIPELMSANELARSSTEADIALQAQRQAAYAPPPKSFGEE